MSLLATHDLAAFYGDFQALFGVNIAVNEGQTVALIGANGAGKSTALRTIAGTLAASGPMVTLSGQSVGHYSAPQMLKDGVALVPEGRRLFGSLSVEENLLIGGDVRKGNGYWTLEKVYGLFPVLRERRKQAPTSMSGGQQQMVAIGRALMSNPRVLLCDEISLGLAPIIVEDIYKAMPRIKTAGTSILVVEQDVSRAVAVADYVYCMMEGRVTLSGLPGDLTHEAIHEAYFGAHSS